MSRRRESFESSSAARPRFLIGLPDREVPLARRHIFPVRENSALLPPIQPDREDFEQIPQNIPVRVEF